MNPKDVSEITQVKYFKIERVEHGSDTNISNALVFAHHKQLCPIAISVEFADAFGNTIPVSRAYVRDRASFLDYVSGAGFPIKQPITLPGGEKCQITYSPNQYLWDEDVLREVKALYADVEKILEEIPEIQPSASVQGAIEKVFSQPPSTAMFTSSADGYIDSPTLSGHRWEVNFLKEAVAYELSKKDDIKNPSPSQTPGIPFAAARAIIHAYEQANPNGPALTTDTELGLSVTKQINGVDMRYIQWGDQLYPEPELRFAIETIMAQPLLEDDPPRLRQRVVFYLSCQTLDEFRIAASLSVKDSLVTTVHPNNEKDDGYGNGAGDFNSAVIITPVKAYQPSPGHPGFLKVDPVDKSRLTKFPGEVETPLLAFYEQYIELWLGRHHFELELDTSGFSVSTDKDSWRVYCASANHLKHRGHWGDAFPPHFGWLRPDTSQVIGTVQDLASAIGGEMLHYAPGRILIGYCMWRGDMIGCLFYGEDQILKLPNQTLMDINCVDIYGTLHRFKCDQKKYPFEHIFVTRI